MKNGTTHTTPVNGIAKAAGANDNGTPATDAAPGDASAKGPASMRRRAALGLVGLIAIAGLAAFIVAVARAGASRGAGAAVESQAVAAPNDRAAALALSPAAAAANRIDTVPARLLRLAGDIQVVGNVSYDADHLAIVGPLVSGRIAGLAAGIGSRVRRGQVIAEIESVDVGEARAGLIAATARLAAAEANLRRERELGDKQISSAREREIAEAQWASERAAMRAATQRLRAIGLSEADVRAIEDRDEGGRVPIRAPLSGTVIERLVTLGQAVERSTDAFKIADLSKVWVLLDLYEKDLARVRVGQAVELRTDTRPGQVFPGRVAYVVPVIDEATRAAKVRVEIDNPGESLHIGQLVSAKLVGNAAPDATPVLTIPRDAVQRVDGRPVVFVKNARGFERRYVDLGVSGGDLVEVRFGLREGDAVAGRGAFLLKSELLR